MENDHISDKLFQKPKKNLNSKTLIGIFITTNRKRAETNFSDSLKV